MEDSKPFNVTPAQLSGFRALARAADITVPTGNVGRITDAKDDVILDMDYDGVSKLTVSVVSDAWCDIGHTFLWKTIERYLGQPIS